MTLEKLAPEKVAIETWTVEVCALDCAKLCKMKMLRMVPESIGHLDYHELLTQR